MSDDKESANGAVPETIAEEVLSPEEQAVLAHYQNMVRQIAAVLEMDGVDPETALRAAAFAIDEEMQMGGFVQTRHNAVPNNTWGVRLSRTDLMQASEQSTPFVALKQFQMAENADQELAAAMMVAFTCSPLARAFLHARGWKIDFFQGAVSRKPRLVT